LLKSIVQSTYPELLAYHFDDLGIPDLEEMNSRYGGPEQWQAYNAQQWFKKSAHIEGAHLIVLDGQVRPTVILEAASQEGFSAIHITLIECSHEEGDDACLKIETSPNWINWICMLGQLIFVVRPMLWGLKSLIRRI
jgi:hypothetical protein